MARARVVATLGEMMRDRGAGAPEWVDEDHAVSENGLVGVVVVHDERSAAPVANAAEELGVERVVVVWCGENNAEVFDERELMFNPTQHVCSAHASRCWCLVRWWCWRAEK